MNKIIPALILATFLAAIPFCAPQVGIRKPKVELPHLQLPEGFHIEVFAEEVKNARAMALGDNGTVFVGSRNKGKVYAVVDKDNDFKADAVYTLYEGLSLPSGLAFRDGTLYISEISRILKVDNIESQLESPPPFEVVYDKLPTDRHHGWKYLGFGPDGKLYVPVGAPCNICDEEDEVYASITRMNPDGSEFEVYASGIRNTVGFDWHPDSGDLWFTENGRDWLGDDLPPDELNCAPKKGMHFGFPYCHAGELLDKEFGEGKDCADYTAPALKLDPHVAAIGMTFYTGDMFPAEYKNRILFCEHGSWNRSKPIGYRVMMADTDGTSASHYKTFVQGWLSGSTTTGRPADVMQMPDGSVLVSDDYGDKIYRITYQK